MTAVKIGRPLKKLPRGGPGRQGSEHWEYVAETCAKSPGSWFHVEFPDQSQGFHVSAVTRINRADIAAFSLQPHEAAIRNGKLYVRAVPAVNPGKKAKS